MSQCEDILTHLQLTSITPREALSLYGCNRLSARILELRHAANDIKSKLIRVNGRHGKAWISRYSLA